MESISFEITIQNEKMKINSFKQFFFLLRKTKKDESLRHSEFEDSCFLSLVSFLFLLSLEF
jgi:hypothetical protein